MIKITFNAFSFLNTTLKEAGINCGNATMEIENNISVNQLITNLNLEDKDVEAVFSQS